MLCMTIEFQGQEWYIDNTLDELRLVENPHISKDFKELTEDEIEEIQQAIDHRLDEATGLNDTMQELTIKAYNKSFEATPAETKAVTKPYSWEK